MCGEEVIAYNEVLYCLVYYYVVFMYCWNEHILVVFCISLFMNLLTFVICYASTKPVTKKGE